MNSETIRRAYRLCCDTGMHAFRWTREQSIDYLSKHTVKAGKDIQAYNNRYIAWPGESHPYTYGELKIFEPCNRAEKERREKPNILDCHDVVPENGIVSLDVLERHVNYYMKSNAN